MYYLFLFARWLAESFSRTFCYRVADFFSWIKTTFARKDVNIVAANLMPLINDREKSKQTACRVIHNFAYYLVDFCGFSGIDKSFIDRYVTATGLNHLDDLLARKEKIIMLSAHLGNYELGAVVLSVLGYDVCALALPHRDRRLNDFFNHQRNICGVEVAQTGAGLKNCLRALKDGKLTAFVGDRDFFGRGRKVNMLGRTCVMPRGPAAIASRTGAWIVPVFMVREDRMFYRLIIGEPASPFQEGKKKSENQLLKECAEILGQAISRYPEQWYLFEKYWID